MMSRPHFKITRHEFQNVKMAFRGRADTNSQAVIRKLMFQTTRVVVASSSQSSNSKSWAWETEETDRPSLENISHWVKSLHFVQKCPINQAILKLFVYQFQLFVYDCQWLVCIVSCMFTFLVGIVIVKVENSVVIFLTKIEFCHSVQQQLSNDDVAQRRRS